MKTLISKITFSVLLFSQYNYAQTANIVYQKTVNSIVTIETDKGLGSGFFIANNLVATNYHVIEDASTAIIILNSTSQKYKVEGYVAKDESNDLAILKVSYSNGVALKFATNNTKQGDDILAIGSPKGIPATISKGIVSNLNSEIKLIQIDASISHGSSGGPVLNMNGEVIGVAVGAIENGQNLNFAIPVKLLENLLNFKNAYPISLSNHEHNNVEVNKVDEIKIEPTEKLSAYLNSSSTNLDLSYIKNLILLGADVNSSSKHGFTSLMEASYQNDINFVKLLIAKGADINAESTGGFTPIHYAQTEVIRDLLRLEGGH